MHRTEHKIGDKTFITDSFDDGYKVTYPAESPGFKDREMSIVFDNCIYTRKITHFDRGHMVLEEFTTFDGSTLKDAMLKKNIDLGERFIIRLQLV